MSASIPAPAAAALAGGAVVVPLTDLGVLAFDGIDAATFLQGQLSNDVAALDPGRTQRTSYNSAKGRMLANLRLWRPAEGVPAFRATVAADLAGPLAKRLAMFVLRAKVKIADESASRMLLGVAGPHASGMVEAVLGVRPGAGAALAADTATVLGLPDGRVLIETARDAQPVLLARLAREAVVADAALWRWTRIQCGVPLITAITSDQFVPQTLNFDLLDGISFSKGCYPGQEIVARMQYLGRLKERLFPFRVEGEEPAPGTRLYGPAFGEQPSGTVVNAAPHPDGGSAVLAVVQRAAVDAGELHLGTPDGPRLRTLALPYPVPEPAPPRGRIA
jgi:folate-binding protein YgfZ